MTGTTLNLIFKSLTIIIHFGIFKKKKITQSFVGPTKFIKCYIHFTSFFH